MFFMISTLFLLYPLEGEEWKPLQFGGMEKGSWKKDRWASSRRGVGDSRHRERPFWETDQEDACCSISVSQIAQAFGTTWVFTMRSVDLHGWAWGGGVLETPKLSGKWVYLHIFTSLVKGIWDFHQILKGILDPKGLNYQCNKTVVITIQNSWV